MTEFDALRAELRVFADERDWQQFHTPKNLALALAGEVGELAAIFQWLTPEESHDRPRHDPRLLAEISDELADILIYLIRLADVLEVDLVAAAERKIGVNRSRFPT